ncbi:hypothetical protein [Iningainema tapete]|uniref:PEP-CTERM protein-sorting domain-containing protein n=1 Tax=Iningainema tapete BLCC-T55 TaxID=2748662 RepID=A0A8J7C6E6_9CYAN|nr:hypothetical protein [Iningainema tapete]MBD2774209.1 hypothetical protein [Iningainema tapete BLCC-T55]
MLRRSHTAWLVPLALTFVSICSSAARATAQTIYPFLGNYTTVVKITPISGNVSQVVETGFSLDAQYGLNQYDGLTYSVADANGNLTINNDPEVFGLTGYPLGYITFGSGTNKVFGLGDASASVDLANLTAKGGGVVNITGGEGIFENATGTLLYSEEDIVTLGDIITLNGKAVVSGSIEVPQQVPEPGNTATLVGIGAIGSALMLRRYRNFSIVK